MNMRHREEVARRKLNAPDCVFYSFDCIGPDAVKLVGTISKDTYTKGPKAGKLKYNGTPLVAVVTDAEAQAEAAKYRIDTGNCAECIGEGKVFKSWDHIEGTKYKPCPSCVGTGKAEAR